MTDVASFCRPSRAHGISGVIFVLAFCLAALSATLVPGTTFAEGSCPNEALRAESSVNPVSAQPYSAGLPDCRAYEVVSSEKENNQAALSGIALSSMLVSSNGDSLLWQESLSPYGQPTNGEQNVVSAVRGASGWSSPQTLAPANVDGIESFLPKAASGDLSTVLLQGQRLNEINEVSGVSSGGARSLFESGSEGCCTKIASGIVTSSARGYEPAEEARVSADGNHVFIQTHVRLRPTEDQHGPLSQQTGEPETRQVYEWTRAGGLRLSGVDSEGHQTSPCGAVLADGKEGTLSSHDVSADGSRVFFQSPDNPPSLQPPPTECKLGPVINGSKLYVSDLYLREDGSRTVDISRPPAGVPDYGASFVGATPDGSLVFFVSETQLTPDKATSGPGHADLYEYNADSGMLTRLSVGPPGYDDADLGLGAVVESLQSSAIVSADGSHAYFTARGQLVPGVGKTEQENIEECERSSCTANLYMYTGGRISFIATVGIAQQTSTGPPRYEPANVASPLDSSIAEVTPDGADLVFSTERSLTAYDSEGRSEIYRYDATNSTISCVSCSPTGGRPEGAAFIHAHPFLNGAEGDGTPVEQVGGLSSDGSTVFFDATGQRLPAAVNSAEPESRAGEVIGDVYEWRDSVLSLISSGLSNSSDVLIAASPSGADVFFTSFSQFVGQDDDHSEDIYDARTQGGFAAPFVPAPCVSLVACRSMLAVPPVVVAPASVSVSGAGNVAFVGSQVPQPPLKVKVESRSEKLAKALKVCKGKRKRKRASCEAQARGRYGPRSKAKRSTKRGGGS